MIGGYIMGEIIVFAVFFSLRGPYRKGKIYVRLSKLLIMWKTVTFLRKYFDCDANFGFGISKSKSLIDMQTQIEDARFVVFTFEGSQLLFYCAEKLLKGLTCVLCKIDDALYRIMKRENR